MGGPAVTGVVVVRKYPNRRLYDTAASTHITQDELYDMIARGATVQVVDAATEHDITGQTLAVALIERDPARFGMVPGWFFHALIRASEQSVAASMARLWGAFVDPILQMQQAGLTGGAGPGIPAAGSGWSAAWNPMGIFGGAGGHPGAGPTQQSAERPARRAVAPNRRRRKRG